MEHSVEKGLPAVSAAATWVRGVSQKCCECTDGHHDWTCAYGTEGDVRISRDAARALADLLDAIAVDFDCDGEADSSVYTAAGTLATYVLPPAEGQS